MQHKQKEEYRNSPGRFRQMERFPWTWDFDETHVREGHDCVSNEDRVHSRAKGAKLTFGEVLDSGVGRMLYNLGAHKKKKFHDLGMGPGKMLFQTYLMFPNMTTCMGVELAQGRYKLAKTNMTRLIKCGWRGRKFQLVELGNDFMKIVEITKYQHPEGGFSVGDSVVAFKMGLRKHQNDIIDYNAKVTAVEDGKITVKYNKIKDTTVTLDPKFVFTPGTERTCEIWFGSLFDYPNNWDAEMCILETDFPENMHKKLIDGMCSTPVGCTFLTYHDLRKFPCYRFDELRQLDVNVYDNDRFLTSWSQGWRFYTWEHVIDPKVPQPLPAEITPEDLAKEDRIRVFNQTELEWSWAKVSKVQKDAVEVTYTDSKNTELIKLKNNQISLNRPRFQVGQKVMTYNPDWVKVKNFTLHPGTVKKILPDGGLQVVWENLPATLVVRPQMAFTPPERKFKIGQDVLCCWTAYAVNKNSPERYRKFKAQVEGYNDNGTYIVNFEFQSGGETYHETSDAVREMWVSSEEEERIRAKRDAERHLDPRLSLCMQKANFWTPRCVSTLLLEASHDKALPAEERISFEDAMDVVMEKQIDGKQLLTMTKEQDLKDQLGMSAEAAKLFAERYMTYILARVDKPASKSKRKKRTPKRAPGGGVRKVQPKVADEAVAEAKFANVEGEALYYARV